MKKQLIFNYVFILSILSLLASCKKDNVAGNQSEQNNPAMLKSQPVEKKSVLNVTMSPFGSPVAFPRGLKFGPDGYLYVAVAGFGGNFSTDGNCTQVIPPIGPYKGGNTSKIIKISPQGVVSTVADHLPSQVNALGFTSGVSAIEFIGNTLYALMDAGCSHGNPDYPSSVIKVYADGTWSVIADLSTFFHNHPVAAPEADDFEPDGDSYSMVYARGNLYVIEANHGELLKVTTSGNVSRVLDFSAHFGHIVPTSVAYNDENFFVGNLRTFPLVAGSSNIYKVTSDGDVKVWETGFTGVLGVAFDEKERMYVLETSAGGGPTPNTGRVVRINKNRTRDVIADKLFFPTALTFGPDGAMYVSNNGFGPPTGQILKFVISDNVKKDKDKGKDRDKEKD